MEIRRELDLPAATRSLLPMRDFVSRCLGDTVGDPTMRRNVQAALDEALCATLLRSDEERRRGTVNVTFDANETRLRVVVRDDTDGSELSADGSGGVVAQALKPRRELGLDVLRRVMDEVRYNYRKGFENELELIKFL